MKHRIVAGVFGLSVVAAGAGRLDGRFMTVETALVPVARLASNLERQLAENPKSDDIQLRLARLYGMAAAMNADEVPTATLPGRSREVWFGHASDLIPYKTQPPANASRAGASRNYRQKSLDHYRAALMLNPNNLLARLGYGWTLDQSGDKAAAIREYRTVIEQAWPVERERKSIGFDRFYTQETAGYLIPLLDPENDAAEIADLRGRMKQLDAASRAITPIAIPMLDNATPRDFVDQDAAVRFDADGTGRVRRWTWITSDAGWLVYDPDNTASITSALQWFGNVTFWLFWENGYEALAALDDDNDGELTGLELRHLAIWRDKDGDAIADAGEVRALADYGIRALSCEYRNGDGLLTAAESEAGVRFADGSVRPSYDVLLRPAWSVSTK